MSTCSRPEVHVPSLRFLQVPEPCLVASGVARYYLVETSTREGVKMTSMYSMLRDDLKSFSCMIRTPKSKY